MSVFTRITRRDFLRQAGVGTGALVFGFHLSPRGLLAEDILHFSAALDPDPKDPKKLPHFVAIELLTGRIIIMANRSEMGQGIRSSLAAVLADELEADWKRVVVRQADADGPRYAIKNPIDGGAPEYLISDELAQFADSSRSMAIYFLTMRLIGAGIRLVLERAAAIRFGGVNPADCEARQHKVWHKGDHIDYGNLLLLKEAGKQALPSIHEIKAHLKPSDGSKWNFIGKDTMPFVDVKDMVTGKAKYAADVDLPGMLTAMIVRCPVANGTVKSFDARDALAVPGVKSVTEVLPPGFPIPGGVGGGFMPHAGVAVVAENTWAALQGKRALKDKIEWNLGPNATYDSKSYRDELKQKTDNPGIKVRSKGDVDAAPRTVKADYYVPHLAQAPMEPPAAVALFKDGCWEVWSATQGPELTQHYVGLAMLERQNPARWLAWQVIDKTPQGHYPDLLKDCEYPTQLDFDKQLGIALNKDRPGLIQLRDELKKKIRDKVKVHVTLLGGGFGRKSKPDFAIEAAFLAEQHPGVPIRVQWTREDDIQFSYFHAVSHQHLEAALDGAGHATAWLQRSAFPSFFATLFPPDVPGAPSEVSEAFRKARAAYHYGGVYPYASGIERAQGLEDMPFDVQNLRIENCEAQSHIRVGWMRSVSNIFHAFATGCFADELADAAGRDSKVYLLELIGKGRRFRQQDLVDQGFVCFDNNGFPVEPIYLRGPDNEPVLGKDGKPVLDPQGRPILSLHSYPLDTRRLRAVVERVAKESGWDEKVKKHQDMKGRGLGIAAHRSFLSYVAMVIDVSLNERNELKVNEVFAAYDCGIEVNPDRVRAQMEGGIVYGLSLALFGEISVKKGAVEQHNFDDYPVLRLYQTPKIATFFEPPGPEVRAEMVAEDPEDPEVQPSGVGEIPVPPVAPALANAIFAASGRKLRLREVPFNKAVQVL